MRLGKAVVARTPDELVEQGIPRADELVVWQDPWTYYKAFPVRATRDHSDAEEGEILRWALGKFVVNTNHPKAHGAPRQRIGLVDTHGTAPVAPSDYEGLTSRVRRALPADQGGTLYQHRPELPDFPEGPGGEDDKT